MIEISCNIYVSMHFDCTDIFLWETDIFYIEGRAVMSLSKNFLWCGALAAHQFEGGVLNTSKGLSVADVMTAGADGVPREITDGI